MNQVTINELRKFQRNYLNGHRLSILDVGSRCIPGQRPARELWANHDYLGVDHCDGENVDKRIEGYHWNLGRTFDVITCLCCLEHTEFPHVLMENMAAHLKPGGYLFAVAPFVHPEHKHPIDCYRYAPDGLRSLCKLPNWELEVIEAKTVSAGPFTERNLKDLFFNLLRVAQGYFCKESVLIAKKL